jgi:CBS domain-containing protein
MPGYPFDGGRVARGFFWYLTGDLFTATKIVGYIGYVVIMAAMTVGVLLLVSGGGLAVWGFWVLMTAFMVNRSLGAGISHIYWTVNSRRLRVDDLFVGGTRRIRADTLIDDAIERLLEGYQDGPMLVVEDDVAIGLVDLASIRPVPRSLWTERRIRDVLTPLGELPRVTSNASLRDLVDLLPPDVGAVALIMRDERVIGATDRRDVVRRLQEYLAAERIEQLRRGR